MKRESISKEVLRYIKSTTGYTNVEEEHTLESVNFDEPDIDTMSIQVFKNLSLGEDNADILIQDSEEIYLEGATISDYIDAVYGFIHE